MNVRACLLLHGFTGGPYEVQPLARHLAGKGWVCEMPTLPGHGGLLPELRKVRYGEWIKAVEMSARSLTEKYGIIDLVGFSMGGLLATYAANRFPVRRMALLNAAVYYVSPVRFVRNAVRQLRSGGLKQLNIKYGTPIGAVVEFTKLVRELKPELARVSIPTFIAQSELDEIVHPRSAAYIAGKLQGRMELARYAESRHMICSGPEASLLFGHIERFFNDNTE